MKTVTCDSTVTIDSPIGPITLKALGDAVVKVDLLGLNPSPAGEAFDGYAPEGAPMTAGGSAGSDALYTGGTKSDPSPALVEATSQLRDFFAGKRKTLDFKVALDGTEFQRAVWGQIAKVGFGEVITYAEIARRIGNPSAVRAVGGAVGSNPVPLVIGCHRILGSGDKITGYSGGDGLPTKRWLLAHEGIGYRDVPEVRRDAETPLKLE